MLERRDLNRYLKTFDGKKSRRWTLQKVLKKHTTFSLSFAKNFETIDVLRVKLTELLKTMF